MKTHKGFPRLGAFMRDKRIQKRLSVTVVSRRLGVTGRALEDFEAGSAHLALEAVVKLMGLLEISPRKIVELITEGTKAKLEAPGRAPAARAGRRK